MLKRIKATVNIFEGSEEFQAWGSVRDLEEKRVLLDTFRSPNPGIISQRVPQQRERSERDQTFPFVALTVLN